MPVFGLNDDIVCNTIFAGSMIIIGLHRFYALEYEWLERPLISLYYNLKRSSPNRTSLRFKVHGLDLRFTECEPPDVNIETTTDLIGSYGKTKWFHIVIFTHYRDKDITNVLKQNLCRLKLFQWRMGPVNLMVSRLAHRYWSFWKHYTLTARKSKIRLKY